MAEQETFRLTHLTLGVAIILLFSFFLIRPSIPPISTADAQGGKQRGCAAAGQGLCCAKGKLCSCQDVVSSENAGEMDEASTAVLVLDTEQSSAWKRKIQIFKNYSVALEYSIEIEIFSK